MLVNKIVICLLASSVSLLHAGWITNGGFETGSLSGWTIYGSNNTPSVSAAQAHSGTFSALLGSPTGPEPLGDSALYQSVTGVLAGDNLSFWYLPATADVISFDWQDAYILDSSGGLLATIFHQDVTDGWTNQTFDLTPFAGQAIRVAFLVHQDGFGDDTSMFVDDVQITNGGVPEPASMSLGLIGLSALGAARWSVRRRARD